MFLRYEANNFSILISFVLYFKSKVFESLGRHHCRELDLLKEEIVLFFLKYVYF